MTARWLYRVEESLRINEVQFRHEREAEGWRLCAVVWQSRSPLTARYYFKRSTK